MGECRLARDKRGLASVRAILVVLVLFTVGACALSGDGDAGADAEAETEEDVSLGYGLRTPDDPGPGCGPDATTPPGDRRPDRNVARCAPGAPAARPLGEPENLKIALNGPAEALAPLVLAEEFDELAAENLTVELVEMDRPLDAYEALGDGAVDAVVGDLHAAFFDGAATGDGSRLILGGPVPAAAGNLDVPQAGLWMAPGVLSAPSRWIDLQSHKLVLGDGISGASAYPVADLLLQGDMSLNDVQVVPERGASAATLLLDGEASLAWLEDPHWLEVAEEDGFELVATRSREALGGVVVSERLVDPEGERDVGLALVRALIRTINTHLTGDYRDHEMVSEALADLTGWDGVAFEQVPPLVFDWEVRTGTLLRIQEAMLTPGAVLYNEPVDEDLLLDRSLYEEVVAAG